MQAEIDKPTTEAFRRDLLTSTKTQLQAKITAAKKKLDDDANAAAKARVDTITKAPKARRARSSTASTSSATPRVPISTTALAVTPRASPTTARP